MHGNYLLKTLQILTYVFDWLFLTQCLTPFPSINHLLCLCAVFDSISSNIDEVLSISASAIIFLFGDLDIHHKNWLTYSGGTDRSGKLCYNISNELTQMVDFPTWISDCDSHSPALLNLFISSESIISSTMAFPPLGNSDHIAVSVSINFPSNSQWDALLHRVAYDSKVSSDCNIKFRQASNCCKKVLEAAKLTYANKTKESIT